jgi:hypothetical protein
LIPSLNLLPCFLSMRSQRRLLRPRTTSWVGVFQFTRYHMLNDMCLLVISSPG